MRNAENRKKEMVMKKFGMVMAVLVLVAGFVQAVDVRLLTLNEAVAVGATHAVTLEHTDLTTATTNTAQVFNVPVLAKQGVEVVAYVLREAFQDVATNGNNTLTLTVGDGSTADLFLTSTEMCVDGTEVYLKFPTLNAGTVALTPTTTNLVNTTDGWTNAVWIAATAAFTPAARNQKVYTADGNLVLTVTPHTNYAVSAMDKGKVEVFFRVVDSVARLR